MVAETAVETDQRTLVLTAFPAEADAILARTTLDGSPVVVVDGRHYYLGILGGKKVIVAMTGIGMVNAADTIEAALAHFTPQSGMLVRAVVFAGVAGGSGRTRIGDVAIPARWTADNGTTWHAVDPEMLAAADDLAVELESAWAVRRSQTGTTTTRRRRRRQRRQQQRGGVPDDPFRRSGFRSPAAYRS